MLYVLRRYWSNFPLTIKGLVVIGLPVAIFVFGSLHSIFVFRQFRQADQLVHDAFAVQLELESLQSLVLDASSGVRSYLLTKDERYLETYTTLQKTLPEELERLSILLASQGKQHEHLQAINQQMHNEISVLGALLKASAVSGQNEATIASLILSSQLLLETLKQQFTEMQQDQVALVQQRKQAQAEVVRFYYPLLLLSLVVGVVGSFVAMRLFGSGITKRIRLLSINAERLAKGKRLLKQEASRDEIGYLESVLKLSSQLLALRETELEQASAAIRHKYDELTERHQQIVVLSQLGALLQQAESAAESCDMSADKIMALCPEHSGAFYLFDAKHEEYKVVKVFGATPPQTGYFLADQCRAARQGQYYLHRPPQTFLYCDHSSPQYPVTSFCVTLSVQDKPIGMLHLSGTLDLPDDTRQILVAMADRLALALYNLQLRDSLRDQVIRDPLTGLYNRRYLEERLERELQRVRRSAKPLSLILADIDHFKRLNDSYGHRVGDEVLKTFANLLNAGFRAQDIVCRYGGEEFVIVLPDTALEDARLRAERLVKDARRIGLQEGAKVSFSISLGLASYPLHSEDAISLLERADKAMYEAKRAGRDRVVAAK